jgi:steroid delta-isomerase-like uncharacterized protein
MSTEENKAVVRRYVQAFNSSNLDAIVDGVAPDFVLHIPGSPDIHGPEGVKQWAQSNQIAFPDTKVTIVDLVAEGDKVAKQWTFRGTHRGEFVGIPPTGKEVTFPALSMYRLVGGKIAELWMSYDLLDTMQQLGVIPPMGEGGE